MFWTSAKSYTSPSGTAAVGVSYVYLPRDFRRKGAAHHRVALLELFEVTSCAAMTRWLDLSKHHSSEHLAISKSLLYACWSAARWAGVRAFDRQDAASAVASGQPGITPSRIRLFCTPMTPRKRHHEVLGTNVVNPHAKCILWPRESPASNTSAIGPLFRCIVGVKIKSGSAASRRRRAPNPDGL